MKTTTENIVQRTADRSKEKWGRSRRWRVRMAGLFRSQFRRLPRVLGRRRNPAWFFADYDIKWSFNEESLIAVRSGR